MYGSGQALEYIALVVTPDKNPATLLDLRVSKPGISITDKNINATRVVFVIWKQASAEISNNNYLLLNQNTKFLEHRIMITFYRETNERLFPMRDTKILNLSFKLKSLQRKIIITSLSEIHNKFCDKLKDDNTIRVSYI